MAVRELVDLPVAGTEPEDLGPTIRTYLDRGDVKGLLVYLAEVLERWPDSERARHYYEVLRPGTSRSVPGVRAGSVKQEFAWLREHGHKYPGCWILLRGDELVAADPSRRVVLEAGRQDHHEVLPTLYFQPDPDQK